MAPSFSTMTEHGSCPKCGQPRTSDQECPYCGVIYAKVEASAIARLEAEAKASTIAAEAEQNRLKREAAAKDAEIKVRNAKLRSCSDCGATIARSARNCPHCGAKQKKAVGKAGTMLAGIFILTMIYSIAQQSGRELPADNYVASAKKLAISACTARLTSALRDPDSLVIDNMVQAASSPEADGSINVFTMLDIRARNGFGGMNRESYTCEAAIIGGTYKIKQFGKTS